MGRDPSSGVRRHRPTPNAPAASPPAAARPRSSARGSATSVPLVHHVRADGSAALLLDDDDPRRSTASAGRAAPEHAVMLELADRGAGRPARTRPRRCCGSPAGCACPSPRAARRIARRSPTSARTRACSTSATAPRWCGSTPARPCSSDAEGTRRADTRRAGGGACPTRSAGYETHWLAHLEDGAPRGVRARSPGTCRPRCATPRRPDPPARRGPLRPAAAGGDHHGDHDVRLAFGARGATRSRTCGSRWPRSSAARSGRHRRGTARDRASRLEPEPGERPGPRAPARVTRRSAKNDAIGIVPADQDHQRVQRLPAAALGQQQRDTM